MAESMALATPGHMICPAFHPHGPCHLSMVREADPMERCCTSSSRIIPSLSSRYRHPRHATRYVRPRCAGQSDSALPIATFSVPDTVGSPFQAVAVVTAPYVEGPESIGQVTLDQPATTVLATAVDSLDTTEASSELFRFAGEESLAVAAALLTQDANPLLVQASDPALSQDYLQSVADPELPAVTIPVVVHDPEPPTAQPVEEELTVASPLLQPLMLSQPLDDGSNPGSRVGWGQKEGVVEKIEAEAREVGSGATGGLALFKEQAQLILGFAGPALGIWLSHPLMSLIDTAVIGNSSALELAALGPGTVMCDQVSFLFMFLSVATSNLIATSMAQQDPEEASRHLARLLFVAGACGCAMLVASQVLATPIIRAFVGTNTRLIPAATSYAKIRGYAWPAVLVTSVAQSASLGLQDSLSPLRVLLLASAINLCGDLLLCPVLGMGIAGAAWATTASQIVGCLLMLLALHRNSSIRLSIAIPSLPQLTSFLSLAAPIFLSLFSKVGFYTLLTFIATSLGTIPLAAHQVLIGIFALCAVCAEPLSQTAQSYLPGLTTGSNRDLGKARSLLLTLTLLGVFLGFLEATAASLIPWVGPSLFTSDAGVIAEMRSIVPSMAASLVLNPVVLSSEGALMAARDVSYLARSMFSCVALCSGLLWASQRLQLGLQGNWWTLVAFQVSRLLLASLRLTSSHSILSGMTPDEEEQEEEVEVEEEEEEEKGGLRLVAA